MWEGAKNYPGIVPIGLPIPTVFGEYGKPRNYPGFSCRRSCLRIEYSSSHRFGEAEYAPFRVNRGFQFFAVHKFDRPSKPVSVAQADFVVPAQVELEFLRYFIRVRAFVVHRKQSFFTNRPHRFPVFLEIGHHVVSAVGFNERRADDLRGQYRVGKFERFGRSLPNERHEKVVSRDLRQLKGFALGDGFVVHVRNDEFPYAVFFSEYYDFFERFFHRGGSRRFIPPSSGQGEFSGIRRRSRVALDYGIRDSVFRFDFERSHS